MMRSLMLATAAVAALSVAACSKPADNSATPDANPAATVPTPANEAAAPDFVNKAAASDMFEVAAGKLAAGKSTNAQVKEFANMMVTAHTKTTADLKAAITASGQALTPPAALPDDLQKKLDDLGAKTGADFDKAYIDGQIDAHQAALDLMTRYAQDGDVAQIKDFANTTAPAVQEHLTKAKSIKDALDKM